MWFRENSARDVGRPKERYDPFSDPGTKFVPGVDTGTEATEIQRIYREKPMAPQVQQTPLCKSNRQDRQQSISPDCVSVQQWFRITNADEISHASYEQAAYALITGHDVGSIGAGKPGEIGYMPPDPRTYDDAVSGVDAVGWRENMAEERWSLIEHDVFEWVDPPAGIQAIP